MIHRRGVGLVAVAAAVSFALAACSSTNASSSTPLAAPSQVATTSPTTKPAVSCNNATSSFAPMPDLVQGVVPPGSFMQKIRARGHLVAAVSADTLLFGYRNPFSGKLEGFDIDMVREIAKEIFGDPSKVTFKVVTYAQRIPALNSGAADIVADVMTINCERWTQIAFSSEYFHAGQRVLVRTDSKATGINDLNGKKMCAAKGSTNLDNLKNYPKVIAVPVDDISDCMVLFQQGSVDSVTGDDTVLAGFLVQDPYAKVVGPAFTDEPYGLGIAKAHPEFVEYVNAILERMRADGTWAQMYRRWLHPTGGVPAPPPPVYGRQR
jgi:polar amino acid transport system substrate-binding protein